MYLIASRLAAHLSATAPTNVEIYKIICRANVKNEDSDLEELLSVTEAPKPKTVAKPPKRKVVAQPAKPQTEAQPSTSQSTADVDALFIGRPLVVQRVAKRKPVAKNINMKVKDCQY
ncbi:uncharacterized protein [Drosophila bipectinata]|uniref:uncharacterized protein n=1 Tax=Drosophila bipectinata TaxID=42026 RepID=UPI0038B3315F